MPSLNRSRNLVLADIGNSAVKLGITDIYSEKITQYITCENVAECRNQLNYFPSSKIFYSSVRPGFEANSLCPDPSWGVISAKSLIEIADLKFADSLDMGIDRKLACLAVCELVEQPVIVITVGTATTLSLISENTCNFSVIWPGMGLSVKAIDNSTRIRVNQAFNQINNPQQITSIQDSVNVGVLFSTVFAIEGWVAYFTKHYDYLPNVVLTGGYSQTASKFLAVKHITEKYLTIKGLFQLFLNSKVKNLILG
ncbi:type III pantothenate kinase [Lyngbya aestuarii]|uniref:type III pantothenate kinase n=1 Tax=Lyngbya aestuarii TaxID=118322 RepID=UPI00403DFB61